MYAIKTLFQFEAKLGETVDHSVPHACYDWMHSATAHPSAEQCQEWGLLDVATPPQRPYSLTWYCALKVWQDAYRTSERISAAQNTWYEFARFADNMCEIYSPHHVTRECLIAYAQCMVDRGLTPAVQRFRLKCIESIIGVLAVKRVLKSNPARGLHRYDMVH
jgi:hypothetical protein